MISTRAAALVAIGVFCVTGGSEARSEIATPWPSFLSFVSYSPDGGSIAFGRHVKRLTPWRHGDIQSVHVIGGDGTGERVVLSYRYPPREQVSGLSWSPRGGRLAITEDRGIWITEGRGKARLVVPGGSQVDWSPDGERIVFTRGIEQTARVYVARWDGSGARKLADGSDPDWSPRGGRIAFASRVVSGRTRPIHVINPDGRGRRALRETSGERPIWSPNGRKILYRVSGWSPIPEAPPKVYVTDADGDTRPSLLGHGVAFWSPSGRRLAMFVEQSFGYPWTLVLMNPDGSRRVDLGPSWGARWSPDGRRLAFTRDGWLTTVGERGDRRRRLARGTVRDWSRRDVIAFTRDSRRCGERLYAVRADASRVRALTPCLIIGSIDADLLLGTGGRDRIEALDGDDRITGRGGRDELLGGGGNDKLFALDGRRDLIACGSGLDSVRADPIDRVARDCERVRRA